ncbi:hypothetical protein PJN16_29675, partial [Mycobacterium kansasii]
MSTAQELEDLVMVQGDLVKAAKQKKMSKEEIAPLVEKLKDLKKQLQQRQLVEKPFDRTALESLLAKRFFIAPSFAIYGGVA